MTMRTDNLTQSLPQKGSAMSKNTPQAEATPHHQTMGASALAAMQHLSATGAQQAVGHVMDFGSNPHAAHEDFTPRSYASKPTNKG